MACASVQLLDKNGCLRQGRQTIRMWKTKRKGCAKLDAATLCGGSGSAPLDPFRAARGCDDSIVEAAQDSVACILHFQLDNFVSTVRGVVPNLAQILSEELDEAAAASLHPDPNRLSQRGCLEAKTAQQQQQPAGAGGSVGRARRASTSFAAGHRASTLPAYLPGESLPEEGGVSGLSGLGGEEKSSPKTRGGSMYGAGGSDSVGSMPSPGGSSSSTQGDRYSTPRPAVGTHGLSTSGGSARSVVSTGGRSYASSYGSATPMSVRSLQMGGTPGTPGSPAVVDLTEDDIMAVKYQFELFKSINPLEPLEQGKMVDYAEENKAIEDEGGSTKKKTLRHSLTGSQRDLKAYKKGNSAGKSLRVTASTSKMRGGSYGSMYNMLGDGGTEGRRRAFMWEHARYVQYCVLCACVCVCV